VPAVLSTPLWHACLRCAGYGGTLLVVGGAVALMIFRLREPGLRSYTTPGDILNLAAFAVTLSVLGLGCLFRRPADPDLPVIARGLLAFDLSVRIPGLVAAGLIMSSLLAAYVPLTHMSHFIAKFFTYHAVRWDDAPLVRGGKLEVRIAEYLTYRPAWAASHVGADGSKTWADIARSRPAGEVRK
jgi:nitrate reductase gamma subunit